MIHAIFVCDDHYLLLIFGSVSWRQIWPNHDKLRRVARWSFLIFLFFQFKFPSVTNGKVYYCEKTACVCLKSTSLHAYKRFFKSMHIRGCYCNMFGGPLFSQTQCCGWFVWLNVGNVLQIDHFLDLCDVPNWVWFQNWLLLQHSASIPWWQLMAQM